MLSNTENCTHVYVYIFFCAHFELFSVFLFFFHFYYFFVITFKCNKKKAPIVVVVVCFSLFLYFIHHNNEWLENGKIYICIIQMFVAYIKTEKRKNLQKKNMSAENVKKIVYFPSFFHIRNVHMYTICFYHRFGKIWKK